MKPMGIISTTALLLLLGMIAPVDARQEKPEEKERPAKQEQPARPEKKEETKAPKQQPARPEKQQQAQAPKPQPQAKQQQASHSRAPQRTSQAVARQRAQPALRL